MPGYVSLNTATLGDLGDGGTRVVSTAIFYATEETGRHVRLGQGYAALDRVLARGPA